MTAVTLLPVPAHTWVRGGKIRGYNLSGPGEGFGGVVIQLLVPWNTPGGGLLFGNHIVDASSDRVCVV